MDKGFECLHSQVPLVALFDGDPEMKRKDGEQLVKSMRPPPGLPSSTNSASCPITNAYPLTALRRGDPLGDP